MEDKLREIFEYQQIELNKYQDQIDSINSKIKFMSEHNFKNELRFLQEKKDAMIELFLDYKKSTNELGQLLDAWLS